MSKEIDLNLSRMAYVAIQNIKNYFEKSLKAEISSGKITILA